MIVHSDRPGGPRGAWRAGEQLEALRFHLAPEVELLASHRDRTPRGHALALLKHEGRFWLWHDTYDEGSRDRLGGPCRREGPAYVRASFGAESLRGFATLGEAARFCVAPDTRARDWDREALLVMLDKIIDATPVREMPVDA